MRKTWLRILSQLLVVVLIAGGAGAVTGGDWAVTQMSGRVTISVAGAQPVALTKGASLAPGGVLTTGIDSRAFLVRNQDSINVGPNAAIAIPDGGSSQLTTILENAGVVAFSIDHQKVQHFAVETPYLAAVVKGTQFSVEVNRNGGTVTVTQGVVEVTALATGYVTTLQSGQSILVGPNGGIAFAGGGAQPVVYQGKPRAPLVGLGFAARGGGLGASVNAGPASVQASIGRNGAHIDASTGPVGADVSVGGDGANVEASVGLVGADVSVGGDGASVQASVGGIDAGASVGSGGIDVNVGGAGVSVGGGGIDVDVGGLHLDLGR